LVSSKNSQCFSFGPMENLEQCEPLPQDGSLIKETVNNVSSILPPGGTLEPGSSITVALWVRGQETSGMMSLPLLFYYTSASPHKLMPHRVVRKAIHINCRESVSFSVMKSRNLDKSLQLLVSISNVYNSVSGVGGDDSQRCEIGLTHVVCISSKWRIRDQRLFEYSPAREGEMFHSIATLDRMQEDHLVVSMLNISTNQLRMFPFKYFFLRYCTKVALQSLPSGDVTIGFAWKSGYMGADKSVLAFGQHFHSIDSSDDSSRSQVITTATGMFCETSNLQYAVRFKVQYDMDRRYIMQKGTAFVNAPVSVTLYNCMDDMPLLVQVVCPGAPTSVSVRDLEANGVRESFAFWWVSQSTWVFVMQPLSSHTVNLQACFFKAGTYNLNNLSILVSTNIPDDAEDTTRRVTLQDATASAEFVKQTCSFATFITIEKDEECGSRGTGSIPALSSPIPVS
jgi:hypothetical protein